MRSSSESITYIFGNFKLYPTQHILKRDNKPIQLRPKVFNLLLILIRSADRLVSKEEILSTIWPDVIVTDNALTHCIEELRKALGDKAKEPVYIETFPRLGYKFIGEVTIDNHDLSSNNYLKTGLPRNTGINNIEKHPVRIRWYVYLSILFVILTALVFRIYKGDLNSSKAKVNTLAILTFDNLGGDTDQNYIAEGITEDLIASFSKINNLKVIGRTSAIKYYDQSTNVNDFVNELNITHLLDGSVRYSGSTIQISVQLIDAREKTTIWSQKYENDLDNLFYIQKDIISDVTKLMNIKYNENRLIKAAIQPTENIDAYILYLKGRYEWNKRTEPGFKRAFEYFSEAIEVDHEFYLAYTGLADSYSYFAKYHIIPASIAFPLANNAILAALEINENQAEAHISLGVIQEEYFWNWQDAEKEYKKAIALNPESANAHKEYAELLMFMGDKENSLNEIKLALETDPLSIVLNGTCAHILYRNKMYADALDQFN